MAYYRGEPIQHTFPAVGDGNVGWSINDASFHWGATTLRVDFRMIPGIAHYWIEWSDDGWMTHHTCDSVVPQSGDVPGDIIPRSITGFEPGSTWQFRAACATTLEEAQDVPPEQ